MGYLYNPHTVRVSATIGSDLYRMFTRAVHLDTHSGINAILRFIEIRGKPNIFRSDNVTNLAGAGKDLREAIQA